MNKDNALQFSYGQRITRPSYQDIAPFVVFIDPFTFFSGNPKLKPTQTSNFQGSYTYKEFILTAKYSIDKNYIANFQTRVDPVDNKTYYYSANLDWMYSYSLSASFPVKVMKGWEMQNNFLGLYQTINTNYLGEPVTKEQITGSSTPRRRLPWVKVMPQKQREPTGLPGSLDCQSSSALGKLLPVSKRSSTIIRGPSV
ncbi:MAG: outer membrane beta-barrel protein [Bacteroidota bacterium]